MPRIEQVIVYSCSYCSYLVWFSRFQDLAYHIYKEHIKQALELLAKKSKHKVKKKNMKWCLI